MKIIQAPFLEKWKCHHGPWMNVNNSYWQERKQTNPTVYVRFDKNNQAINRHAAILLIFTLLQLNKTVTFAVYCSNFSLNLVWRWFVL